jgi:hypothetical protein
MLKAVAEAIRPSPDAHVDARLFAKPDSWCINRYRLRRPNQLSCGAAPFEKTRQVTRTNIERYRHLQPSNFRSS